MINKQLFWSVIIVMGWVSLAQATGLPLQQGVTVMTPADLQRMAATALVEAGAGEDVQVTLHGRYPSVIYQHERPFRVDMQFSELDRQAQQFAAVGQLVTTDGTETLGQPFNIRGRYAAQIEIPVLNRRVSRDEVIAESDIIWLPITEHALREDTVMEPEALVGMSPKRIVSPNRPVRMRELERPAVIQKGDMVTLYFKTPFMELKTLGEAMRDGADGELIGVRNTESYQTVKGIVTGPGMVRVQPGFTAHIGG